MKVVFPIQGLAHTSKDILPTSCTSKPQVSCTSVPKIKVNEGFTNQEIYQGIVSVKDRLLSIFGGQKTSVNPINYLI